jgi:hypothetical protein
MLLKKIFKSQLGASLVEVAMTAGLLGIAGVGVMTLANSVSNSSSKSQGLVARTQFTSALGAYLLTSQGCDDLKLAKDGGPVFSNTPEDIALMQWGYMGFSNIRGGTDGAGKPWTKIPNMTLSGLKAYLQPAVVGGKVNALIEDGSKVELQRSNLVVQAEIMIGENTYNHLFNLPVLVGATDRIYNHLKFCNDERSVAEACAAMRGVYNPQTQKCDLDQGCIFKDTYNVLTCRNPPCDLRLGNTKVNKYTGATSCPEGSQALSTHVSDWMTKRSSGKKSTINVQNRMEWYSCMACPSP